jgi:hypothetical protein
MHEAPESQLSALCWLHKFLVIVLLIASALSWLVAAPYIYSYGNFLTGPTSIPEHATCCHWMFSKLIVFLHHQLLLDITVGWVFLDLIQTLLEASSTVIDVTQNR